MTVSPSTVIPKPPGEESRRRAEGVAGNASAVVAGRRLDTMITRDEWTEIQSWPATTCGGAFMHDPRNTSLIALMERVVAR